MIELHCNFILRLVRWKTYEPTEIIFVHGYTSKNLTACQQDVFALLVLSC